MAKGWAEGQSGRSTHVGKGLFPLDVSRCLFAFETKVTTFGESPGLYARLSEEPGCGETPSIGSARGGRRVTGGHTSLAREQMPMFQFLLHTTGIRVEFPDDPVPAVGFYTNRNAFARTPEMAFAKVMRDLDTDPKTAYIFQEALDAGLRPKTEIEEVYIIPWWKVILPRKKQGLCLYPADEETFEDEMYEP